MFGEKETHESYGMVGLVRRSSSPPVNLFGSSIKHSSTMALTVQTAEKHRDLSRDWYFGRKALIEIELSQNQFAEMITGVGVGDGVPCTIRYFNGERKDDPPEATQRQLFEKEFKRSMNEIGKTCYGDIKEATDILRKKGSITVGERAKVANIIERVVLHVTSSMPFIQSSFNEAMDKTVTEAKGEVEAFIMNKVTSLGIETLKDEIAMIPEKV